MTASACETTRPIGATCPILEYGWSPVKQMMINGKMEQVKCMTIEDAERLRVWMITVQEMN